MMTWKVSLVGLGLLSGVLAPCNEPKDVPPAVPEPRSTAQAPVPSAAGAPSTPAEEPGAHPRQQTPTTKAYMKEHFAEAALMRRAALAGQLGPLKAAASGLAGDAWTPNLRSDWKPHVASVRAAAQAANTAASLAQGTEALGALGEACASCHRDVGGPSAAAVTTAPAKTAERPMLEHAGAEERLWQGLAFPSDAAWASGLDALKNAPALGSDVAEVAAVARRLDGLVQRARDPGAPRGKLYGEIVTTCASCHQLTGIQL